MIYLITASTILTLTIILVSIKLFINLRKESQSRIKRILLNLLEQRGFFAHEILIVNKFLILAINRDYTKLVVIENFNPDMPHNYSYKEIATAFIYGIEKNNINIRINYVKQGDKNTLYLAPIKKETRAFCHNLFKTINFKRIQHQFSDYDFKFLSASDWMCNYIWTYCPSLTSLAYMKTTPKIRFDIINLRNDFFTIDTKYNYFETTIKGVRQQLLVYEPQFLDNLWESLFNTIKQKASTVTDNLIYYDNHNNIVYLSNGISNLQSVLMNKVEEINIKENRIYFSLYEEERALPFIANEELIKNFEEFIISYNLGKIAKSFDYKTDKLINTTPHTKFIIDFSRDRVLYCANLNKIAKFSFISMSFSDIEKAIVESSKSASFVRIFTKNKEVIDISCTKLEVAQYISAQLGNIIINH